MHRLFVAIRPPEAIRDRLIDAMADSPELGWVSDDNLHLTLRFIGEVETPLADDLALALGRIRSEAFELRIDGVGLFERRNGGALWAAVSAQTAGRRARRQGRARLRRRRPRARAPRLPPAHHPGPLSARRRSGRARLHRAQPSPRRAAFVVTSFILYESRLSRHGAHYEEVAEFPLG